MVQELRKRTCEPARNVAFVFYSFLATIVFGCLGIWIEIYKAEFGGVITAVIAFFPTLIGPTALQLILASHKRNETLFIAFAFLILILSAAAAMVLAGLSSAHQVAALIIGIGWSAIAIWMWWITNGGDPIYKSSPPDAATGGDPARGLGGNLSGFQA